MRLGRIARALLGVPEPKEPRIYALWSADGKQVLCRRSPEGLNAVMLFSDPVRLGEYMGGFGLSSDEWQPRYYLPDEAASFARSLRGDGIDAVCYDPPANPFEGAPIYPPEEMAARAEWIRGI